MNVLLFAAVLLALLEGLAAIPAGRSVADGARIVFNRRDADYFLCHAYASTGRTNAVKYLTAHALLAPG